MITMCNRRRPGRGFAFILITVALFLTASAAQAAVWYVNAASTAASPDGRSWATAYPNIQPAVDAASSSAEVWVAAGTYTGTGDQVVNLKEGVTLYGGFTGTEGARDQRDWTANPTIINGQGSRRCVTAANSTSSVDGFTLQNGMTTTHSGGMYNGTATNCTFTGNSANCGGGMYYGRASNCIFTGNSATDSGGGMYHSTASNCTIAGNSAARWGGGMCDGGATNCVIWGNSPDETERTIVSFSCLSIAVEGTGNIVDNPDFVYPRAGDFRLRATSLCIDAGTAAGAPSTDMLGRARPRGAGIDMGAYEYYPGDDDGATNPPILRVNAASTAVHPDGLTWATAFSTLQTAAINTGYGGEIWVAEGAYTAGTGNEVVLLRPGTVLFGGFAGTETLREQRDSVAHPTVIDGQGTRRCITANTTSSVDGFTIKNGAAQDGGGMYYGTAVNCTFAGNSGNCGGGMFEGTATNCTFTGNSSDWCGGGLYYGTALNCTFAQNSAYRGGGILSGTATNCVFWGNAPTDAEDTTVSFSCLSMETGGAGNIVGEPGFVNPWAGNFRLRATSPCIDSGTAEGAPSMDMLGRARPQGAGIDMGAYEYYPGDDDGAAGPSPILRVSAASTATYPDGLTWATAFSSLQAAAIYTACGGEIWVAEGAYTASAGNEVVLLGAGTALFGGFAGTETLREQRDWTAHPTIIDGQGVRRCVSANSASSVDGFALQKGFAQNGGGLYSGTATNCTFTGNSAQNGNGAGIYYGTATNCTFTGNSAQNGAGIYYGTAFNCTFSENSADYGNGGGMCGGMATNCTFSENSADYGNGGGMCGGTATNCVFHGNTATGWVFCEGGGEDFHCYEWGGSGGGMSGGTATNCTFAENSATFSGGGMYYGTATNCVIWGNAPYGTYSTTVTFSCTSVATNGTGNIVGDPLFVNVAGGDLRVQPGSPCIDAGTATGAPSADILGTPRPQGAGFDMGAYEMTLPVVTVPDLSGLGRTEAREAVIAAQLLVGKETEAYHPTIPVDHVISQSPVAGTEVAQRTPVNLVISMGPPPVPVPAVTGHTQDAATAMLASAGLVVGMLTEIYSTTVPAGTVIAQDPAPGMSVRPGTAVDLVVSKGGIAVPNVTGQPQSAASTALVTAGLVVGTITQQYSLTVPVDHVIAQSVASGTPVLPGTAVDLVVSKGGIAVPNVTGQAQGAAASALVGAGLVVGTVTQQYSLTVLVGDVISQSVAAGTSVLPGAVVDLVISKGAIAVPDVVGQPQSAASTALMRVGLVVGTITQQYSATVPVGAVISQTPAAGTSVLPATAVALVISRGVQPSVMPDVVGQPRAQAGTAIGGAGLALGLVARAHSTEVVSGSVVLQSPAAGTELPPGTVVSIVVSLGPAPAAEGEGEPVNTDTALGRLSAAYESADTNGDGTLSFGESSVAVTGLTQAVFNELDANDDGQLDAAELGVDQGAGCTGCRGGKGGFTPADYGKRLGGLFLEVLGALGLAMMSTLRRP